LEIVSPLLDEKRKGIVKADVVCPKKRKRVGGEDVMLDTGETRVY